MNTDLHIQCKYAHLHAHTHTVMRIVFSVSTASVELTPQHCVQSRLILFDNCAVFHFIDTPTVI